MTIDQAFENFISKAKEREQVVNYFQVRQHGDVIFNWSRLDRIDRLNMWSVSKSVISVAVGIAQKEGIIDLEEKISETFFDYVPKNADSNILDLKVRHLLTMTTGLDNALFFAADPERYTTEDWTAYFFSADFTHPPFAQFLYSNFNTYILGHMLERKCGMDLLEYMKPRIFDPLEIYSPDWTRCPRGHLHAANGLYLTIDEMSRFGQMLFNGGEYNGKRIVPEDYIQEMTRNQLPEDWEEKYGYQIWIEGKDGDFRADGKFGQFIIGLKDLDMVISVMSLDSGELLQTLREEFIDKIKE